MVRPPLTRSEIGVLLGLTLLLLAAIAAGLLRSRPPDVRVIVTGEAPTTYRININTASAAELTLLPGIGPMKARRIVEYRRQHGPFRSFEDLSNVSGIGDVLAERIAERATLDVPPGDR